MNRYIKQNDNPYEDLNKITAIDKMNIDIFTGGTEQFQFTKDEPKMMKEERFLNKFR